MTSRLKRILEAWALGKAFTLRKNNPKPSCTDDEVGTLGDNNIDVSLSPASLTSHQRADSVGLESSNHSLGTAGDLDDTTLGTRHSTRAKIATTKAKNTMNQRKAPMADMLPKPRAKQHCMPESSGIIDPEGDDDIPSSLNFPVFAASPPKKRKACATDISTTGTPQNRVHPQTPYTEA